MSISELRRYVLKHRDDMEAMGSLFYYPSLKWKTMPPLTTLDGMPAEENISTAEETIKKRIEMETNF